MRQVTENDITSEVLKRFESTSNARLKFVMQTLVKRLHSFVREVDLSESEWMAAIRYLNEVGRISVDGREEFILLSDTLGVSMLVDLINHRKPEGATESTVLGPFYLEDSPEMEPGGNIAWRDTGTPALIYGRVLNMDHQPVPHARMDLWQTSSAGLYDVQDRSDEGPHMRGRFHTDADGKYLVRTVRPTSYPIPSDGPVGRMLCATGRTNMRPAHVHFMISAPGLETLTTHLFDSADPKLDADAVFGVKESLVCDFVRHEEGDAKFAVEPPFYTLEYDFIMKQAEPPRMRPTA